MAPLVDVEITISSARDLKNVNWKHGDLCAYAVAWIEDGGAEATKMTTKVDASGDTDPSWGQKFTLSATKEKLEDARLILEVYHDKAEDAAKAIVGSASLPLLDVVDAGGYDEVQDYTMKLKRPSGRPHGKLELAIRLRERRGVYGVPPPSPYHGQRDWQSAYPGYSPPYPAQPAYAQPYPAQAYPYAGPAPPTYAPSQPYGSYAPPQPYGSSYAPPAQPYGTPPHDNFYGQPPPPAAYQETPPPQKQGSKFGGIGTGLAVGALAGAVGGLAMGEYIDHKEDEAAEEQAEEDAERYGGARDDGYGGGDDGGYGEDDY
ncbi:hypothetical protein GOP47_0005652 [Adiantum capillus-veneris]|uniref:C2 domain-containing protein n=1 Tax=Adiantum capillus-veneris TaxID=13818 RepID=A0A9D4V5S8_ADICA|nr:hypothetical protein GOP47_0005652 [Adiantum capillus-veneris]